MKLDLRKTKASTVVQDLGDDFLLYDEKKASFFSDIKIDVKSIIGFVLRIVVCAVGTFVLIYFEKQNINKLNVDKAKANTELNAFKKKQAEMEKQIEGFEYIAKKSKEYEDKVSIMETIVDKRLSAITGLDKIQGVIPEEVWLKKVEFRDKDFTITGISTTNKQIQNFVEELEKTRLFSKVNLEKAEEENRNRAYSRRRFIIVSTLR